MHATAGLCLGADWEASDGRRFGRDRMFRDGSLGRRRELPSLFGEADAWANAGTHVHVASSLPPLWAAPVFPRLRDGACGDPSFCWISDGSSP